MLDHQIEAVARMQVAGASVAQIAAAVGVTPATIRRHLAEPTGKVAERLEAVQGIVLQATATHYFEMLGMLEQARTNIQGGLCSGDEKERNKLSMWLIEHVAPRPAQRIDNNVNLTASPELTEAMGSIARSAQMLAEARAGVTTLRVRSGTEALPTPVLEAMNKDDAA